MSLNSITIPSNSDFEAFIKGQQFADHPRKRAASLILTIVAGFLLYAGLKTSPMDERMTYGGVLTLVYIFFGRNMMFKIKIKSLWKQKRETNPEVIIDEVGVAVRHENEELNKTLDWADFGFYRFEEKIVLLYPKKTPENWLTLSLRELDADQSKTLKNLIETKITITAQPTK